MLELNNKINKLYVAAVSGINVMEEGEKAILRGIFANMDASDRANLMKEAGVFDRGNIREKRDACVDYMLKNVINKGYVSSKVDSVFEGFSSAVVVGKNKRVVVKERKGLPMDVIRGIVCGLVSSNVTIDKAKNIISYKKDSIEESIILSDDDFENTRIVLDLLSIPYNELT